MNYQKYEKAKRELIAKNLPPADYEKEIKKIVRNLETEKNIELVPDTEKSENVYSLMWY